MRSQGTTALEVRRYDAVGSVAHADHVATEEPMEIRVVSPTPDGLRTDAVSVTMRTPGHDFELALGFLYGEGIVRDPATVLDISYCPDVDAEQTYNVVNVVLSEEAAFDPERLRRNFYTTSSCGVCGKASLEMLSATGAAPVGAGPLLQAAFVRSLPHRLREAQPLFDETGGLHAAGLFDAAGRLLALREDVGRHNAMDKLIGHHLREGSAPFGSLAVVVSGRASWELMQKAVMAGIPTLVAVGAPSSLAVELAREFGMTLIGFARDGGFNVYAGAQRIA
jgi:FdhD protein